MQAPVFEMALCPGSDRVMNYYSSVVLFSKRAQYLLRNLNSESFGLYIELKKLTYLGRTCDPHRRAKEWRLQQGNALGVALRKLESLGFEYGKDYLTACRVWFRFKGAKNTPQRAWDLPESAFKILCARDPFILNNQNVEALCEKGSPPVTTNDVCRRWTYGKCTRVAHKMLKADVCGK